MHDLKRLEIWKKAIDLAVMVHEQTKGFPSSERHGLRSQINRSADSIPSNISEGAGRHSTNAFVHFLSIANGSAYELQTQLIIALKLGYIEENKGRELLKRVVELQKMNHALQNKLGSGKNSRESEH